jgi:hypothetical protein
VIAMIGARQMKMAAGETGIQLAKSTSSKGHFLQIVARPASRKRLQHRQNGS